MEENKKERFWDVPEGKVMAHGIHEHNSGLSYIINSCTWLEKHIKINYPEVASDEKAMKAIQNIRSGKEKCKEAMDYVYVKFKEKHESGN